MLTASNLTVLSLFIAQGEYGGEAHRQSRRSFLPIFKDSQYIESKMPRSVYHSIFMSLEAP